MNKDGYVYSIVFMFVLTACFTAILAITYAAYLPVIEANEANLHREAIAKVLDLDGSHLAPAVSLVGETPVYAVYALDGRPISYAFYLSGQGLWGPIRGYIGVSAGFSTLLGLEFVEQNETPGLGGRIDEPWFKAQFKGIPISPNEPLAYGDGLDAVTGATSSSNAVLRLVNERLQEIFLLAEVMAK